MNIQRAKNLQKKMNWKQLFYDELNNCFRLIDPSELIYYKDEEGRIHKRKDVSLLHPVNC